MLTREEFISRFRGRHLLFLTEAWAARKMEPSALGMLLDSHARQLHGLLVEMYDALVPKQPQVLPPELSKPPVVNGAPAKNPQPQRKP